jgi:hypothetical protein
MSTKAAETEQASREEIEEEIEKFRQIVIAARSSAKVEPSARRSQTNSTSYSNFNRLFSRRKMCAG